MANQMNLLKLREVEAHDIVNLYSTMEGALSKGTVLEYVSADPDNHNGYGVTFANTPSYAFNKDYVVNWKVQAAPSGSRKIAGVLLYDVVTNITDPWVLDARFAPLEKLAEKQIVISGRAVPFARRGRFEVSGIDSSSGAPAPGNGIYLSASGAGLMATGPANTTLDVRPRVGTCLAQSGIWGGVYIDFDVNLSK